MHGWPKWAPLAFITIGMGHHAFGGEADWWLSRVSLGHQTLDDASPRIVRSNLRTPRPGGRQKSNDGSEIVQSVANRQTDHSPGTDATLLTPLPKAQSDPINVST